MNIKKSVDGKRFIFTKNVKGSIANDATYFSANFADLSMKVIIFERNR